MRRRDLPAGVLQQVAQRPVQHPGTPLAQRRRRAPAPEPLPRRLHPDQRDLPVAGEGVEHPHRVRAAAHARHNRRREPPLHLEDLAARLAPDHRLEVAHHAGERVRPHDRTDDAVGAGHVGHPVPERLVGGVLEGAGAGFDRPHLGAQQLHAVHVERPPLHVLGPHVDDALQVEERAGGGGGDAVLPGSRLGDDPGLAHPAGEERLADGVVDLVGAGVVEILALEVDGRDTGGRLEAAGAVEGGGAADVVRGEGVGLGQEGGVGERFLVRGREFVQRRDQRLGDVAAAVGAEASRPAGRGNHCCCPPAPATLTARTKARVRPGSLAPGTDSTPELTSSTSGRSVATAAPALSGVIPPAAMKRAEPMAARTSRPTPAHGKARPVPPGCRGSQESTRMPSATAANRRAAAATDTPEFA